MGWSRFVALGDSFTEGLQDEPRPDGRHLGWADRVALRLADDDSLEYANLAIRGRLLPQVIAEQVPAACALEPDLVTLAAGVNDALRRSFDLNAVATALEHGVRELRATGATVVLFAFGDPSRRSRTMGLVRERVRSLDSAIRAISSIHGCRVVDFWGAAVFDDDRWWDEDRLHLSPAGHSLVAESVLEVLGRGNPDWRTPPVAGSPSSLASRGVSHARWAGRHLGPWLGRRLRGESSGDGVQAKDPSWRRVHRSGPTPTV